MKDKFVSLKIFVSSKFFVSLSSKQKKSDTISIKKIFIDKSRLFKINQKTLISWKFFTKSSSLVTIDTSSISRYKFVVVISFRKLYTDAFIFSAMTKIRQIEWSTRRWWNCNSSIKFYSSLRRRKRRKNDEYKF